MPCFSKLASILHQDTQLFQSIAVDLHVDKISMYTDTLDGRDVILVDLRDGVTSMIGLLVEGASTMNSTHPKSLLNTLKESIVTGIHIITARVCVYRQDIGLSPLLYIDDYQPIQTSITSKSNMNMITLDDIQTLPEVKQWLNAVEQTGLETFMSIIPKDGFWDYYIQLEPYLENMMEAYKTQDTTPSSSIALEPDTPIPPPTRQLHQPSLSDTHSSSPSMIIKNCFPLMSWRQIQAYIMHAYDEAPEDLVLDGFLPLPSEDVMTIRAPDVDEEISPTQTALETDEQAWWMLYKKTENESTEHDKWKTLVNGAKDLWMNDMCNIVLDEL
ncbi:uncharacterized protein BX664DRAFT_335666 [Halteromyces radiatus]|uniref:uncharacterized protein n=1 Tax=Halteromyces radiatus TaxID=101107 RepID=UPI002220B629|nr:uncharacterized protein BX664DRAFT_335666 [Halteromyces radiatus]KAI8086384.1 hypothetical protein BX664DRAFT_335666 [Halteromyces radiatus]